MSDDDWGEYNDYMRDLARGLDADGRDVAARIVRDYVEQVARLRAEVEALRARL